MAYEYDVPTVVGVDAEEGDVGVLGGQRCVVPRDDVRPHTQAT